MPLDPNRRTTFDEVASLYAEARPGYPEEAIQDAILLSGIPDGGRILEIGPGPGTATLPFARRGYSMLCLELGFNLAALAAENCRPFPNVQIVNVSFEDWVLDEQAFDLVLSAEAFHWISPEVGYPKAAAALKLGGAISLIWHYSPGSGGALHDALDQVYNEIAPELINPERHLSEDVWIARITEQIDTSACFGEVIFRCYPWSLHQSAEEYIRLLNTHSDHRQLNENVRQQLFSRIALLIGDFGGYLDKPYRTHLFVAHLRD